MKKRGFSLIEIILVMIILSVGLTTLILVLRHAIRQSTETHFHTVSNWLCQEKIEEILSERRNNGFNDDNLPIGTVPESSVPGFSNYTRKFENR